MEPQFNARYGHSFTEDLQQTHFSTFNEESMSKWIVLPLLLATVPAGAAVYKCETPTGVVYAERPCADNTKDLNFRVVKPAETATPETGVSNKTIQQMQLNNWARKKADQEREEEEARRDAESRRQKCAIAQKRLDMYQQQIRIYKQDSNGERIYVDDDTRAATIDDLKREIASTCD